MSRATSPPAAVGGVTLEEFLAMPETKVRTEVVDGVIVSMPAPRFKHQKIQERIGCAIEDHARERDIGTVIFPPADVIIRTHPRLQIRQPDLAFFSDARAGFRVLDDLDRLQDEGIAPSLVVEILSPGQDEATLAEKLADYAAIEVVEVWFADQAIPSIRVLARDGNGYRLAGEFPSGTRLATAFLPGFELDVTAISA